MELRTLRYFLTVAREQNISRAAEALHITQPTLSRQMTALEEELGTKLFIRNPRRLILTEEGILLKRRALEMIDLEDKLVQEFSDHSEMVEGTISVGAGEMENLQLFIGLCGKFRERYPAVTFAFHSATADSVSSQVDQGLLDLGLLLEPVDAGRYDYIRMPRREKMGVLLSADDPLAQKAEISKADLLQLPLCVPERLNVQSELANWFGADYPRLHVAYTSNLKTNAQLIAMQHLAYPLVVLGPDALLNTERVVIRPLTPPLYTSTLIVWKRNAPYGNAVRRFLEFLQGELEE